MKRLIIAVFVLFTGVTASAQVYGGWLTNVNGISPADMLSLSQFNYSLGSTRSAAMGGALSALGADVSAIGMNPAGLGMYRRNQFGVSLGLGMSNMYNNQIDFSNTQTTPQINSMGGVAILEERVSGLLTSNIAFVYNKVADMNYSTSASFGRGGHSILDLFALQLNGLLPHIGGDGWEGVRLDELNGRPFDNRNISSDAWGAILAFQSGAVTPSNATADNRLYQVGGLSAGADILPSFYYHSGGYVGQYDVAWGGNINNVIYLGVSVGFQDIWQEQSFNYNEEYRNNSVSDPSMALDRLSYSQHNNISGMGFNAKFGIIIRPTPSFRLGISYHTATAVALRKEYVTSMIAEFSDGHNRAPSSDSFVYSEIGYYSPSRLIVGFAYTLRDKLAVSIDFENVNYDGINADGEEYINDVIYDYFAPNLNVRFGIEYKASRRVALRAGFANYSSPIISEEELDAEYYRWNYAPHELNNPIKFSERDYSLGIGYTAGRSRWDLTYVFSDSKYSPVDMYYYTGEALLGDGTMGLYPDGANLDPLATVAPMEDISVARHNIILSYTYSF